MSENARSGSGSSRAATIDKLDAEIARVEREIAFLDAQIARDTPKATMDFGVFLLGVAMLCVGVGVVILIWHAVSIRSHLSDKQRCELERDLKLKYLADLRTMRAAA